MTDSRSIKFAVLVLIALVAIGAWTEVGASKEPERESAAIGGALAGQRYRVIVSTDMGGTDPESAEDGHSGAKTVSRWREAFLRDFAERTVRCARAAP